MSLTDSCQWTSGFDERCSAVPDVIAVTGCIHEHLSEVGICYPHLARLIAGKVHCTRCYDHDHCLKALISTRPVEVLA
jgi:hypothetical protein